MKGVLSYILFISIWVAWEKAYCNIEISWPWLQLGNAFCYDTWMVQWYEYTGLLGGTVWILFTSLLTFLTLENLRKPITDRYTLRKKWALTLGTIFAAVFPMLCSAVVANNAIESSDPIEVAVIQPNIDPWAKSGSSYQKDYDEKLLALADSVITPNTRYVVTPETFTYNINIDNPGGSPSVARYEEFLKKHDRLEHILFGALTFKQYYVREKPTETARNAGGFWYDVMNSAILVDSAGNYTYSYKSKLVPGAEIIPYQKQLNFLIPLLEKFGAPSTSYARSHEPKLLTASDGSKAAALICYESVYSEWVRSAVAGGASWLAVITNDGWWGDTPGFRQHFRYATLRAIETRRDIVQSANNGRSGVIDQFGKVKHETAWWVDDAFVCNVNRNTGQTFYVRFGDLVGRAFTFIMVLMLAGWAVQSIVTGLSRNKKNRKS